MNLTMDELKFASRVLRRRRIVTNAERFESRESSFNCWNFTAFVLGWTKELCWFSEERMKKLLTEKSYRVQKKDIQVGDIVVYVGYGLEHTALIVDPKRKTILHKDGCWPIELNKINRVYEGCNVTFRRPYKGNKR